MGLDLAHRVDCRVSWVGFGQGTAFRGSLPILDASEKRATPKLMQEKKTYANFCQIQREKLKAQPIFRQTASNQYRRLNECPYLNSVSPLLSVITSKGRPDIPKSFSRLIKFWPR